MIIDFSKYKKTNTYFGGTERKFGIDVDGFEYMIKFRKHTNFGVRLNHISEYLGSHIFDLLGFPVQDTYLGYYDGEEVVACKNFVNDGFQFVPFNDVRERAIERNGGMYRYSYDDIMRMLRENEKLTDVEYTVNFFWGIYIVDTLIGNFDRHGGNWGFLKKDNNYFVAPIFDNGSSLFPNLTDDNMIEQIMNSEEMTNERIYKFPISLMLLNGKRSSYFEVINSLQFKECNDALIKICNLYSHEKAEELIDKTPFMSDARRKFCKYILRQRYDKILYSSYRKLMGE